MMERSKASHHFPMFKRRRTQSTCMSVIICVFLSFFSAQTSYCMRVRGSVSSKCTKLYTVYMSIQKWITSQVTILFQSCSQFCRKKNFKSEQFRFHFRIKQHISLVSLVYNCCSQYKLAFLTWKIVYALLADSEALRNLN